ACPSGCSCETVRANAIRCHFRSVEIQARGAVKSFSEVLFRPNDKEFAPRCSGWNTRIVHRPEYVVAAQTSDHVQDAVRFAAERSLHIRVQATGHGALAACEGGVLIDTSGIGGVAIDPSKRSAVIGAGVRWQEVLDTAQVHDLAGLAGSASPVGVVGYALGGGCRLVGASLRPLLGYDRSRRGNDARWRPAMGQSRFRAGLAVGSKR